MCFPLQSSHSKSDHNLVCYECLLERPATFAWQIHEYIKITQEGKDRFNTLINEQSWEEVQKKNPNVDLMVHEFQSILERIVSQCFSWKRVRRKSNEAPWLTDGLRHLVKKRLSIFRSEGRSVRWKILDTSIKRSILIRKVEFFDRET